MVKLNRSSKPLKGRIISMVATALIPAWYLVIAQVACLADEASRKQEILSAFEKRMEHVRNLHFVCESETVVHFDNNGELGPIKEALPFTRFEYWQRNDSNRQDSLSVDANGNVSAFAATFDAEVEKGVTHSIVGNRSFGYINSTRDPTMSTNRYRFWLNVRDWGLGQSEYLFNYVLDRRASLEVLEQEGNLVQITTDYAPNWSGGISGGERHLWLDVEKGFLPVRGEFRWRQDHSSRAETFEVVESKNVGGIWMPTLLREHLVATHPGEPPIHNVNTVRVTAIEQGQVTASDLKIDFPRNTEFVDATRGVHFVGDENWNPLGPVEPVIGVTVTPPAPNSGDASSGGILTRNLNEFLAVVLILGTLWYFCRRRFTATKLETRARST